VEAEQIDLREKSLQHDKVRPKHTMMITPMCRNNFFVEEVAFITPLMLIKMMFYRFCFFSINIIFFFDELPLKAFCVGFLINPV